MKLEPEIRVLGEVDTPLLRGMLSMFGTAFDDIATYTAKQPDDTYQKQ
jgi:aminoglycoside 3-N-acetyltransferase I